MQTKAKKNAWTRRWREKRKKEGLCAQCGRPRGEKSSRFCDACLEGIEGKTAALRDKRRAKNCCIVCGDPRDADRERCQACADRQNDYGKKCRKKHAKKYAAKNKAFRLEQQKKGLCIRCGRKRSGKSKQLCDPHLEAQRIKARAARKA